MWGVSFGHGKGLQWFREPFGHLHFGKAPQDPGKVAQSRFTQAIAEPKWAGVRWEAMGGPLRGEVRVVQSGTALNAPTHLPFRRPVLWGRELQQKDRVAAGSTGLQRPPSAIAMCHFPIVEIWHHMPNLVVPFWSILGSQTFFRPLTDPPSSTRCVNCRLGIHLTRRLIS